jgi:hypothetical protein
MANAPQFAATPRIAVAQVSTANPYRDGTGTVVTVLTAGSSGTRVDYVAVKAVASTLAGVVRLFIHDGSNARLLTEVPVPMTTPVATDKTFEQLVELAGGIVLPTGYSLRATTEAANTFNVFAFGGDL